MILLLFFASLSLFLELAFSVLFLSSRDPVFPYSLALEPRACKLDSSMNAAASAVDRSSLGFIGGLALLYIVSRQRDGKRYSMHEDLRKSITTLFPLLFYSYSSAAHSLAQMNLLLWFYLLGQRQVQGIDS